MARRRRTWTMQKSPPTLRNKPAALTLPVWLVKAAFASRPNGAGKNHQPRGAQVKFCATGQC